MGEVLTRQRLRCRLERTGVDYQFFYGQSTTEQCASRCLYIAPHHDTPRRCTGFAEPWSGNYCILWFNGACSSSLAKGARGGATTG